MRLRGLGPAARRLLAQCVEHTGVARQKASKSAEALEDAGFVHLRFSDVYPLDKSVSILPSLAGEEAMEMLELMEAGQDPCCVDPGITPG